MQLTTSIRRALLAGTATAVLCAGAGSAVAAPAGAPDCARRSSFTVNGKRARSAIERQSSGRTPARSNAAR
ncbi:hypothetical protein SAZ_09175 [Streptomyces noursei ZPM]|nr:hypothetical protein SAZ_09175 [Streptomyces noursei ZPM]